MNVTFCGHSKLSQTGQISQWLDSILPSLIEGGAETFYIGSYGDFDRLAAAAVRRQKHTYPHIESILVLAYPHRAIDTSCYDGTTYPPLETVPPRYAIAKRNEWMVCKSDIVVSCVTHGWGGAAKTLGCAKRQGKVIVQFPTRGESASADASAGSLH